MRRIEAMELEDNLRRAEGLEEGKYSVVGKRKRGYLDTHENFGQLRSQTATRVEGKEQTNTGQQERCDPLRVELHGAGEGERRSELQKPEGDSTEREMLRFTEEGRDVVEDLDGDRGEGGRRDVRVSVDVERGERRRRFDFVFLL